MEMCKWIRTYNLHTFGGEYFYGPKFCMQILKQKSVSKNNILQKQYINSLKSTRLWLWGSVSTHFANNKISLSSFT